MGEKIIYKGEVKGFKSEVELDLFQELCADFGEEYDLEHSGKLTETSLVEIRVDGWRGGGRSCKDILTSHFGSFFELHPHLKFDWWAEYVEQAPNEHEWSSD